MKYLRYPIFLLVLLTFVGCSDDSSNTKKPADQADAGVDAQPDGQGDADAGQIAGTRLRFEPTSDDFFAVPLPSDTRKQADGSFALHKWKRAYQNQLLHLWIDAADDLMQGWGLVSGIFVNFSGPIDAQTLPQQAADTISSDNGFPSVFLMDVDPDSEHNGEMLPIECKFTAAEGTYHDANLLGCISPFGVVRQPNTRYAFVVTTDVHDADGNPVVADAAMRKLLDGEDVEGRNGTIAAAPYAAAKQTLVDAGLAADKISSIVLFTTGNPAHRLVRLNDWYRKLPEPQIDPDSLSLVEELDDYVVLHGTYKVPIIQEGERPYPHPPGGKVKFDDNGQPVQTGTDTVPFLLTIPKTPMPDGGWPVLMYMHGSGGQMQELVDRGAQPDKDTPAPHGTGPGGVVAPYGVAGFAAEFPFHGTRFHPPDKTGLVLYNLLQNPRATVDNFLVSANEVTLHARLLKGLTFDPSIANGALDAGNSPDGKMRFNTDRITAMGQSMGSTIGLPALTISKVIDAGILSGSGATLIEVALKTIKPTKLKPLLVHLLGYRSDEVMDRFDPVLSLLQYTWDFVDPEVHARYLIKHPHPDTPPKHILQHSGVDDGYFSLKSRTAVSASVGLDFAKPVEEPEALQIMSLIAPDHAQALDPPVSANLDGGITGVVAMYQPSVLDGHNVAYQVDAAKAQYACFAKTVGVGDAPVFAPVADAQVGTCGQQ